MEKVKLYIGSSISDLNKKGKYDFDRGRSIKIHINHSDKTFQAAEEARIKGDEERGYILYMRYLDIFQKVRGSRDYKADESHYSLLLGTKKVNEAISHAEILSKSLKERYEALKNGTDAQDIGDKHADEPKPNGVISPKSPIAPKSTDLGNSAVHFKLTHDQALVPKSCKEITSQKLYELLFSSQLNVLMMDIRSFDDYQTSCIRHPDCINVPKTLIKPGTVCKRIEEGITNIDHLEKWKNRATADIIVLIDWDGSLKRMDDLKDPLRSLNDALVKWEQFIFLKQNPVILTGGYVDWLDYYPQFTTNSKVVRPDMKTKNVTSVTSLTDFSFNELLVNMETAEEIIPKNNLKEEPSTDKEWEAAEVLGEVGKSKQSDSPTIPGSTNIYPDVPQDINLYSKKNESTAKDVIDSSNTGTVIPNESVKKNIPIIDRSKKPSMPSRNLKPTSKDAEVKNIPEIPNPAVSHITEWPPSSFIPEESKPSAPILNSDINRDAIAVRAAASIDRIEMIRKKQEEDERKTKELEDKKKLLEIEALENKVKQEAEEKERQRKKAEKELAELMRNMRKNEKTNQVEKPKDGPTIPNDTVIEDIASYNKEPTKEGVSQLEAITSKSPENVTTPNIQRDKKPAQSIITTKKEIVSNRNIPVPLPGESQTDRKVETKKIEKSLQNNKNTVSKEEEPGSIGSIDQPILLPAPTEKRDKLKGDDFTSKTSVKPKEVIPPKTLIKTNDTAERSKSKQKPLVKVPVSRELPQVPASSVDAKPKRQGSTNLPLNWEKRLDKQTGRYFYLDHKTKTTHWTLPDHVKSKITKTPLRDVASAPSSGGLKRSSSSPNIAQLKDDTPLTDFQPKPSIPNREQKPKASAEAIRSADDYVQRLGNLHPAPGGSGPGLCGLMNLGNTCYMNSVLQCMFNTTLLVEYFVRGTFKQHINRENFLGSGGEITDGFSLLMKASWSGQFRHLTPRDFRFTISKFNSRFGGYTQQDSQELLLFLMDGLHEDLNEITQRSYKEEEDNCNMNDMVAADVAWQHHARLNKSIIVQLFQGQFKATVQCLHCKKSSRKFDVFMYLSLPLPSQSGCSIYDCIKKFSEVEKLSGDNKWRCPDCKTERDAVRKIEIWKLPPVLFIHFKRFSFCGRWGDKVQTSVKFPEKGLDLNDYVKVQRKKNITYQLYSVSHHYGATLDSGHYVASCKNPIDNKWYKYDDHEVSRTSVPSGPSAYILCYTSLNHSLQINTS